MDENENAGAVPADGIPAPVTPNEPQNAQNAQEQAGGAQGVSILGQTGKTQETGAQSATGANTAQGVPDTYDFSALVPEGQEYDARAAGEFGAIAKECGLTQEQAGKIASYGMQYMQSGVNAAMQEVAATQARWGEDARAKLGADFDKTVSRAGVGIDRLSQKIPGLREMFNETGAGNRIEMIQLMAAIGDLVSEDTGHGASNFGGEKSLYPKTNFDQYH